MGSFYNIRSARSNSNIARRANSKAEVSVEILSYYIILSLVFMTSLILIVNIQDRIDEEGITMDAKSLVIFAKNEIDTAISVGDGYSSKFFLPHSLYAGVNYDILINPEYQEISISYRGKSISLPLLTEDILPEIKKGENVIKNSNGMIIFE